MFATLKKLSLVAVIVGSGLAAAGCQSSAGNTAPATGMAATQAVTCSKCQITWVKQPLTQGGKQQWAVTNFTTTKSHECPDCRNAVQNFFATGKLEHTCKTCGDSLEACETH